MPSPHNTTRRGVHPASRNGGHAIRALTLAVVAVSLVVGCSRSRPHRPPNPLIVTITEENFETEVLDSEIPVFVDFWAEWCGPCRMMEPTIDSLATRYEGKLKVAKLNIDDNSDLSQKMQVTGIPTFMIFSKGDIVSRLMGAAPEEALVQEIEQVLNPDGTAADNAAERDTAADQAEAGTDSPADSDV